MDEIWIRDQTARILHRYTLFGKHCRLDISKLLSHLVGMQADMHEIERIGRCALVLRGFALPQAKDVIAAVKAIEKSAPYRHMVTPGGFTMSVGLTNCGVLGWTTDRRGYRYTKADPMTGTAWPAMPPLLEDLAAAAALAAGFLGFKPDACLVNRYTPGAKLTLHQDKNEKDFDAPIVSLSLGMTATFLFGGQKRADGTMKIPLHHGDVVVWGGEDRLRFHGVMTLKGQAHSSLGHERINLTFRKAG